MDLDCINISASGTYFTPTHDIINNNIVGATALKNNHTQERFLTPEKIDNHGSPYSYLADSIHTPKSN